MWRNSAFIAGLSPFSDVGYSITDYEVDYYTNYRTFMTYGNGGLYQVYAGAAYTLWNRLSIGVQGNYIFGNINKKASTTNSDDSFMDFASGDSLQVNNFSFKAGLQYEQPVSTRSYLTLGATYRMSTPFGGHRIHYLTNGSFSRTREEHLIKEDKLYLGEEIGAGLSFRNSDVWSAEVNYIRSDWSNSNFSNVQGFSNVGESVTFTSGVGQSIRAGFEITPNRNDIRYFLKRCTYRAGAYYDSSYVSFEDTLLVRFAADGIKNYIEKNFGEEALEAKMITNVITSAQKKIEGQNFDTRKSLLEYDDVLAKQRQIVYDKRDRIIEGKNIDDIMDDIFNTTGEFLAKKGVPADSNDQLVSGDQLVKVVEPRFLPVGTIKPNLYDDAPIDDIAPDLAIVIRARFDELLQEWDVEEEDKDRIKRSVVLHCIDQNWTKHIDSMARLREAIFLRSYANVNPLQDYVNEGYAMFRECLELASVDAVLKLMNVKVDPQPKEEPETVEAQPKGEGEEK